MTYPSWPSELPNPERSTWTSTPQDGRQARRSDAGPKGYRRRFSAVSKTVALSLLLSRDLNSLFERFYSETTSQGVGLFWMPDPTNDGWPLLASDGSPLLTSAGVPILLARRWLVTFGEQLPSETIQGVEFRRTFSVEVMP